jgi:O-antigen/teichoic acid export membrane protein
MTDNETTRTAIGSITLATQSIINTLLGLVFFIFLARLISQAEMGVYASLLTIIFLFQAAGCLGLPVAASRFIPKSRSEGKLEEVSKYVMSILAISTVSAITSSALLYLLAGSVASFLTKSTQYSGIFALASLVVFATVLATNLDAVMQGIQSFGKLATVRISAQGLRVALTVFLLLRGFGLIGVVFGYVAMNAFSIVLLLYALREHMHSRPEAPTTRKLLNYSFPLLLSNMANFFSTQTDLLTLMILTIPALVGTYNVAVTVSGLLGTILVATISATVQPAAAKLYGLSGTHALESALRRASRYLAFSYVPAAIGLAALGGTAVNVMAGPGYLAANVPLGIISVASVFTALSLIPVIALQTIGDTRSVLTLTLASIGAGLAAELVLIPMLATTGAALGRTILVIVAFGAGLYLARRRLKLTFDVEALRKTIIASVAMGTVLFIMQAELGYAFYNALLSIPVGVIVFLLGMRIQRAIRAEDINILANVLPRRLKRVSDLIYWIAT